MFNSELEEGKNTQSEWDKKVLACLANYAALAVQNESHQQALRSSQEKHWTAETFAAVGDISANLLHNMNNKVGTIPVRIQAIQDKYQSILEENPYLANNLQEIERSAMDPMQSVQIKTRGLEELPTVMAGGQSLTFVFRNLLENAITAMNGEGLIHIYGAFLPTGVEIAVIDSGPGIAPELHSQIFELNFSRAARPGKMGFGLWWVKTLMTRLGGSVTVESDGHQGTTFRVRLPTVEAA